MEARPTVIELTAKYDELSRAATVRSEGKHRGILLHELVEWLDSKQALDPTQPQHLTAAINELSDEDAFYYGILAKESVKILEALDSIFLVKNSQRLLDLIHANT